MSCPCGKNHEPMAVGTCGKLFYSCNYEQNLQECAKGYDDFCASCDQHPENEEEEEEEDEDDAYL